jgi:lipopolysaccharide transport system ATP-binding protein
LERSEDLRALKDVSFEACPKRSEGTGFGRNSAGKSTLLKILSRITEPADGRFGVPTKGVFCA